MPIRVFYKKMKQTPVPLATDMVKKIIVASITDKTYQNYLAIIKPLVYQFNKTDTQEKKNFIDWRNIPNDLYFTQAYLAIFNDSIDALWVSYEALNRVFEHYPGPDFHGPSIHLFTYGENSFWIITKSNQIIFRIYLPC